LAQVVLVSFERPAKRGIALGVPRHLLAQFGCGERTAGVKQHGNQVQETLELLHRARSYREASGVQPTMWPPPARRAAMIPAAAAARKNNGSSAGPRPMVVIRRPAPASMAATSPTSVGCTEWRGCP